MKMSLNVLLKTSMMIALGIALPLAFHSVPNAGRVFLPMHLPVLLAGFLFGPVSGLVAGILTPLLSSVFTGMPPMAPMPIAVQMAVELATFGLLAGLLFHTLKMNLFVSLLLTLAAGRLAYSVITLALFPLFGLNSIPLSVVFGASIITALPGLALQIISIPAIILGVNKYTSHQGSSRF